METVQVIEGKRIKQYREKKGWSLRKLAGKAGISPSMLSQIESAKVDPSLSTLRKIAICLEVPLFFLVLDYSAPAHKKVKVNESRLAVFPNDGLIYQIIHSDQEKKMGIHIGVLEKGGATSADLLPHDGEECLIVLEGSMQVVYENETIDLAAGESLYFDSSVPHKLQNIQDEPCRFYLIISPPKF
ncbi:MULTISPECIES: cupin domain-containing protein [Desulfotignum]|jgi:transcriptional regulator with XRE-family HTH domain|uniref:Transcriptional regulator, MerR family n=2 Tax=Desulfotignum TaxID=115780 RepID=S0FYP4_9BACT|nr:MULTISPECIES: cupin domain-containing protein [Desulfotignum]EMS78504.1 transcriptional regulator, MerR family [Desulfotignum phosphitoxidans DSM 13687]EMS80188.1 transcriptional regulator, MerR family [Desulfotignum phosphitoxidans DSM 13687]MBG0778726.1 helix-turn-helix domain-containing protein [Desulfotignum balticum]